jgi:hypothetical protein
MTDNILRKIAVAAIAAAILLSATSFMSEDADARTARCGNHKDVVEFLGTKYKETRVGMGLINAGQMMELYMSEAGTWTMLITRPDGLSCFGPVGKNWTHIKTKPLRAETGA